MKLFKFIYISLFLVIAVNLYSYDFMATARSIAWGGAYSSASDSFEALAYNPAGIYMTNKKFGFDILGNYSARIYSQYFSTDTAINLIKAFNSRTAINTVIPDVGPDGSTFGVNANILNLSMYINLDKFGMGFYLKNRQFSYITVDKGLLNMLTEGISFYGDDQTSFSIKGAALDFLDFGFSMSTRLRFLERATKIQKIYAGFTSHFYLPLYFAEMNLNGMTFAELKTISTGNSSLGTLNLYKYMASVDGYVRSSGIPPSLGRTLSSIFNADISNSDLASAFLQDRVGYGDFGIGFDFGFIMVFNQYVKLGFAINDLGFLIFPQTSKGNINSNVRLFELVEKNGQIDTSGDQFDINKIFHISEPEKETYVMISPLTMRTGVVITPVYNRYFDLILSVDMSASDFYKLQFQGYPTFAVGTGIEFAPKVGWFRFPLITAFSFNTESLSPSFSFGTGLHLGPVKMMIAVKGLEGLIEGYGSNDMVVGLDFKFEF